MQAELPVLSLEKCLTVTLSTCFFFQCSIIMGRDLDTATPSLGRNSDVGFA